LRHRKFSRPIIYVWHFERDEHERYTVIVFWGLLYQWVELVYARAVLQSIPPLLWQFYEALHRDTHTQNEAVSSSASALGCVCLSRKRQWRVGWRRRLWRCLYLSYYKHSTAKRTHKYNLPPSLLLSIARSLYSTLYIFFPSLLTINSTSSKQISRHNQSEKNI
jgi:hypothetical protein